MHIFKFFYVLHTVQRYDGIFIKNFAKHTLRNFRITILKNIIIRYLKLSFIYPFIFFPLVIFSFYQNNKFSLIFPPPLFLLKKNLLLKLLNHFSNFYINYIILHKERKIIVFLNVFKTFEKSIFFQSRIMMYAQS